MRPIKLTLENVHSFIGGHEVDFTDVNLAVLVGPNGGGKSTVAHDAPLFALFGETRGPLDSIISEGQQACRVEFVFALGDDVYLVSRQRSRKGAGSTLLSFQMLTPEGPVVLDGKSVAETQARIESVLHMNADLLRVTAFSSQGQSGAFSRAKPAARKQVLSEILDLGTWERRAEVARQMGRDVAAQVEADHRRHEALQAAASEVDALRGQIAQTEATQGDVARQIAGDEGELAQAQEAKTGLLRDREADRARRKELEELKARGERASTTAGDLSKRLAQLERSVSGKPRLITDIRQAEDAQTYAQELEAKRQEDERLRHEAELVKQQRQSAIAEHGRAVKSLEDRIAQAKAAHERQARSLRQRIQDLQAQAEPLERVPCAGTKMATECPLIAASHRAREALPGVRKELAQLGEADPTAADARKLAELERQQVGVAEEKRLREIALARTEADYSSAEHVKAKQAAGKLRDLQESLRRVERAEAQLAEVRSQLEGMMAEAKQTVERRAALEKELGPARNWEAMLTQVEQEIKRCQAAIAKLQSEVQSLGQQRGALEERLRAAEQAAEEVENLEAALRTNERRLKLLKILAQAFGRSGIPALLIEKAVPDLEAVANDVLSVLSDGRMSLELRSQRETKAKTIQETLDIVISDEHGQRPYESFSGGEAMRVDLALRIALSMLLSSRAGARCELLVLDETCAPLDTQGQDMFVESLGRIADQFATVLVITHVEALKDRFPYRFEVSKNGDGSQVEMIAA